MKIFVLLCWILLWSGGVMAQEKLDKNASCYVIKKIVPEAKVDKGDVKLEKFVLYDICLGENNTETETIFVVEKGITKSVKAKQIKTFENGVAAQKFAHKHHILNTDFAQLKDCQIIRIVNMPLPQFGGFDRVKDAKPEIVLLNTCVENEEEWKIWEFSTLTLIRNGKEVKRYYQDLRTFKNREEAEEYALQNGLTDVDFNQVINPILTLPEIKCTLIRVVNMPLKKDPDTQTTPTLVLIDVCLPAKAREMQHPMVTFRENGISVSRIFKVVQTFANKAEAEKYALEHHTDIEINQTYLDYIANYHLVRLIQIPLTKKPNTKTESKYALLNTHLKDKIPQQRPVQEVIRNGKKEFREFEVLKTFADKEEAEKYAQENGITDIQF